MIQFNFEFYITLALIISLIVTLINKFVWSKRRSGKQAEPLLIEYTRSLFPVLLVVWLIRSFVGQIYHVPSGSLEPTIIPVEFVFVDQFSYGLHFPVLHTVDRSAQILAVGTPQRGDIALFYWPLHPDTILIKRVIGVPGDHIVYKNKVLTINGKLCPQTIQKTATDYFPPPGTMPTPMLQLQENLLGKKHLIWQQPTGGLTQDYDITVPAGKYFMMGDNRDESFDSRGWGFAPLSSFIGKAQMIVMSWNSLQHRVRWKRIGMRF